MVLSDLSIRRPVFAWMLMIGLIGFGIVSYLRLGISQLPDVDFPVITINLHEDGATPESMEQDVVDVIEDQMMSIEGVRQVRSTSSVSRATVTIEFDLARNIDLAQEDVLAKISAAQKNLPPLLDPPAVTKTNPDDLPIVYLALQAPTYQTSEVMRYARDTLKNKFASISGVGDIAIGGYLEPNMRIWVRSDMLDKYYLSASDVLATLANEQIDPPTGQVAQGSKEYNVRFYGEAASPADFARIPIDRAGGQDPQWKPPYLGQVARIVESTEDVITVARTLQKPSVTFGLIKQRGANAVEVARAVRAKLAEVNKSLPAGMTVKMVFDSTKFIEEAVSELTFTLLLSALLTALVCWLFLGSWSSTINVLFSIPTSIIGAFSVIYFFGFTLNTFTLMALSLAIGIVVDDAIMVLENIIRHQEMGKKPVRAALEGAREITFAATAASISVIAIFLPVAFMSGIIGKFFYQFGVVMSATVAISLVEALTLTPMRAAVLKSSDLTKKPGPVRRTVDGAINAVTRAYAVTLRAALQVKWLVIVASIALTAASFYSYRFLRSEFLPPEDQSRFLVRLTLPVGSSLALTNGHMAEIEKYLATLPEVELFTMSIGSTTQGTGDLNMGTSFVTLKEPHERPIDPVAHHRLTQFEVMAKARQALGAKFPESRIVMQDLSMRGLTTTRGAAIEFTIQGPDWDILGGVVKKMMAAMKATGKIIDIDTDFREGIQEIQVSPDREKTSLRGATIASVGTLISTMIGGQKIAQYPRSGHRYDVRVKLEGVEDMNIYDELRLLKIRNSANNLVPLSEVVRIETKPTAQSISRQNRERAITIYAGVVSGGSQAAALEQVQAIAKTILPPGYHLSLSGSSQTFHDSFQSLVVALLLGIFVAYMVLATQFNSFIDPVTVLLALPFSLTGAFLSLLATNQSINIYSMIGLILLMGIAKKNSILLVEFTNEVRDKEGLGVRDALVKACPIRLRPIAMTSIATVAGAVPQALSIGPGAESRMPMAIALIGGVTVSTLFTLYLIPCAYEVLSRFESRVSLLDREEAESADPAHAERAIASRHTKEIHYDGPPT